MRALGIAMFALLLALALGCVVGSSGLQLEALWAPDAVVLQLRLPRVILGALVGASLALAGVVLQTLLDNPLAEPYVTGTSGGAALGGVAALALGLPGVLWLPALAFLGAAISAGLLIGWAMHSGRQDAVTLLLAGTVLNAISGACVSVAKLFVEPQRAQAMLFWLIGSIGVESWRSLGLFAACLSAALGLLWAAHGALDLLLLGDESARALGLPTGKVRLLLLGVVALLVGLSVAFAGMVSFVGLLVPHLLRRMLGGSHGRLLPACALGGACLLVLCDTASRFIAWRWSCELPAGALTALLGGPYFLLLLLGAPKVAWTR